MKRSQVFVLCLSIPALGYATTPPPYAFQCSVLDRITTTNASRSPTNTDLDLLARVAMGRTEGISAELETRVGLAPSQLRDADFSASTVRAHALRVIGRSSLPGALEFLAGLKETDFETDTSTETWQAARIALQNALLNRIVGSQAQIEFLVNTTSLRSPAASWAVEELCDRGALVALPEIQQSIRRRSPGQRGDDEIRFCEARIQVLLRYPDRMKALGSVLRLDTASEDERLVRWAISQLASMHSANADAELDKFANGIDKLPRESAMQRGLYGFSEQIRTIRRARDAMESRARN